MPNLSIKDVPEAWTELLRQRASRHHRSLQGELMALVERAIHEDLGGAGVPAGRDSLPLESRTSGGKTIEQIVAAMGHTRPGSGQNEVSSIDIIRSDRDAR